MGLLDTQFCDLDIFGNVEARMRQRLLGTSHRTTVDGDKHLARLGRFDHSTDVAADTGQTEVSANATLRKFDGRLVGDLPHIGAAGTRENQYLIGLTQTFLFHLLPSSFLFNPPFDLFHLGNFSCHLHHPIHHQGRSDQDAIVGDGLDILHLDDFGFDTKFFDRVFSSLRELIALRSPHTQDFNLFHMFCLLEIINGDSLYNCKDKPIDQPGQSTEESNQSYIDKHSFRADQFADYKNAGKGDDRVRQKIG